MSRTVLFISTNDWVPWGGSEVLWSSAALQIVKGFSHPQVDICVMRWSPIPKHIKELVDSGVNLVYKDSSIFSRVANRFLPTRSPLKPRWLIKLIRNGYDLVIFSLGDHNEAVHIISEFRLKKIPYIIVVQLAKAATIPGDGDIAEDIRNNYLQASKVFFVSQDNKELLETQLAHAIPTAEVISNPFPSSASVVAADFPSATPNYNLAFVASLNANHKGHDLLFKVLSYPKWRDRNLQVNLYGKGPHQKFLAELKNYYKLRNVSFAGFSSSLPEIWSLNHAAILCSRMEGQSLALLEAMSYNRMPIVTDVGDAHELLEDGVNGFIADAPTVKHIDEALERAWTKRTEWQAMGVKAGNVLRSMRGTDPVRVFSQKILDLLNN